jgi:hypothetical protein
MISLNSVGSLLKVLQNTDANTAKTLIKLVSIDVLQANKNDTYTLQLNNKTLTAKSQQELEVGQRYFAKLSNPKTNTLPTLSHLHKFPRLTTTLLPLVDTQLAYDTAKLKHLLQKPNPFGAFKETLLDEMVHAKTKEHFQAFSHLLFSMHQNVLTLPLYFFEYLGFLQIKKRYNKKTKKFYLNFYANFEHLGPLSGVISTDKISINVVYEEIKNHLEANASDLAYNVEIALVENIMPLYEPSGTQNILDIKT